MRCVNETLPDIILSLLFVLALGCGDTGNINQLTNISPHLIDPTATLVTDITDETWQIMEYYRERKDDYYIDLIESNPTPNNIAILEAKLLDIELLEQEQKAYYKRQIVADDIEIIGNDLVRDSLFHEAREVFLVMTNKYPKLLRDPLKEKFYLVLTWYLGDVPEVKFNRKRGLSFCNAVFDIPIKVEERINFIPKDIYGVCVSQISRHETDFLRIYVHEVSHVLDTIITNANPTFFPNLRAAHKNAIEKGIWEGYITYERYRTNYHEYWAELVEIWFFDVGEGRPFETTEDLEERDPLGTALLRQWFPQVSFTGTISHF